MRMLTSVVLAIVFLLFNILELAQSQVPDPVQPTPYQYPRVNHGHPPDTETGTPPCGYRGSNCAPNETPTATVDRQTGRNIAIGMGVGAMAGLEIAITPRYFIDKLSKDGPQFAQTINMSAFQVSGLVRGGWPLVIDYETEPGTYAVLTIVAQGGSRYAVILPTKQTGRQMQILQLPTSLGTEQAVANFTVLATVGPQDPHFRYFRVYGFGCGLKAVGSVAIDELKFGPPIINNSMGDTKFSFHAHSDFTQIKAEFMQMTIVNGAWEGEMFDSKVINRPIHAEDIRTASWSGKKAHPGQIQFRARGWMSAGAGGDWVSAFSPDLVLKQ